MSCLPQGTASHPQGTALSPLVSLYGERQAFAFGSGRAPKATG